MEGAIPSTRFLGFILHLVRVVFVFLQLTIGIFRMMREIIVISPWSRTDDSFLTLSHRIGDNRRKLVLQSVLSKCSNTICGGFMVTTCRRYVSPVITITDLWPSASPAYAARCRTVLPHCKIFPTIALTV